MWHSHGLPAEAFKARVGASGVWGGCSRHCRTELVDEMRCAIIALHASFDSSADLRAAILSGAAAARTVKHERVRSTQA